jgi:hypothetical protein
MPQKYPKILCDGPFSEIPKFYFCLERVLYLTEGWGVAWDLREMGSTQGKGVREGQAPQTKEQDKQSTACKEGGNMEQEEEGMKSQA